MRKANVLSALMMIAALCGWIGARPFSVAAQGQAQQQSPFKDRAEYDAYNAILQAKEPQQQADLADKYLAAYPQTKLMEDVLARKLQAYQTLNNVPKLEETATKLLEVNPKQLNALLLVSTLFPQTFNTQDPAAEQKLNTAAERVKAGLDQLANLPKPANMSDADFKKQKDLVEVQFQRAAGFIALNKKDNAQAEQSLRKALESNPNDAGGFVMLGQAYLSEKPIKYDQGFWAYAHALSITGPTALPAAAGQQIKDYIDKSYQGRHGSNEGLDALMAQAASAPFPSPDFHIKTVEEVPPEPEPAPVPAPVAKRELTVKAEELTDFGVIEKYLQSGGQKADDTFEILKGQPLPMPGKVVSATPAARPKTIQLAIVPEVAAKDGQFDVELTLAAPYSKPIPKGTTIEFEGTVDSYRAKPFLLRLSDGKITK